MLGKLQGNQRDLFCTRLEDLINPNHKLALLAKAIDWQYFENEFKPFYSEKGALSVPHDSWLYAAQASVQSWK